MILVADNLHVVNPAIADAVTRMIPEPIEQMVRQCEQAGAQAIDVNSGPLSRQPEKRFAFFVETVQAVTRLPLLLDTTNAVALEAGLKTSRNPAIINGFSLEPSKIERILPLAEKYDTPIIGYLLDTKGRVAATADEMMALAVELFGQFAATGLPAERLIIDPVVAPMTWENGIAHNQNILALLPCLPDLLGTPVRTIAGISNLASGPVATEKKIALEQAFLPMLAAAGLEMALLNIDHAPTVQTARTCAALLGDAVFSWAAISPA